MAEQMRPASPQAAPDPARSYGREKPGAEAGLGRLDTNNDAIPAQHPDKMEQAVGNKQDPTRQLNAHDVVSQRRAGNDPAQPDHSMKDEEPMGWDQAPTDIDD